MSIRTTALDDVDAVMDVISDGRASLAALGIDQWQNGYPSRDQVIGDVERGEGWVAEEGGRIIGCAMIGCGGDPDYDEMAEGAWLSSSTSEAPGYVVVHRIASASNAGRRGVASALLAQAEHVAAALGRESIRMDTHPGNIPMQRFLEKHGFKRCGVIMLSNPAETTPERLAYEKMLAR